MNQEDEKVELIDELNESSAIDNSEQPIDINVHQNVEKKIEEASYSEMKPEVEKIEEDITEIEPLKPKSGIGFVIILFILLATIIILLPFIQKIL